MKTQLKSTNLLRALLLYLRPVALQNGLGVTCLMLFCFCSVCVPVYIKRTINGLENQSPQQDLLHSIGMIMLLSSCAGVLLLFARWLIIGASRMIEMRLRNDFYSHIQKLSPGFYHQMPTGDLVTRFSSDIEQVRMLVGPGIMYPTQTLLFTCLSLSFMLQMDAGLTLALIGPIVLLMIYVNYNTRRLHKVYRQAQDIYSTMNARLQENFSGIRVIKAYCQEEAEYEHFKQINQRYIEKNIEQVKLRGRLYPFMKFIGGLGTVLVLWQGGLRVIDGLLTLGDLVQFAIYFQMLMWPIIALGWIINVIHRGVASWRRLRSVLDTEPEVFDAPDLQAKHHLHGAIEVRNLTFAYDEQSALVLENVSFHVEPGQTLAIVGPTGCGKTTIVNLLLHLYTVPPESIFYDGKDINDLSLHDLRQGIAYVSQEVFLFSDSIHSNIAFGIKEGAETEEALIKESAKIAQLDRDVSSMTGGYQTEIGERGITLSGGQKQRTGLARALILNRPVLILDDSLCSVDTDTEEAILSGLRDTFQQRSVIIISHRISTVKNADHIIVLDEGRIIEEGDHSSLVEHGGLYSRIHRRQLLEESLGIRS